MANALYDKGREGYLAGDLAWDTDDVRVMLTRGYTENLASHDFEDDITGAGGTIVSTTGSLSGKTVAAGVADASDTSWTAVSAGSACNKIIGKKHTGTASTSNLIFFIDTATNLPVTPNGGDISLVFDNGANKIFKL